MVYLIHFDRPFSHAGHYVGFVAGGRKQLAARIARHRSGAGAVLLRHVTDAGIGWQVVRTWGARGTRKLERRLKKIRRDRVCPCCGGRELGPVRNAGKGLGTAPAPDPAYALDAPF